MLTIMRMVVVFPLPLGPMNPNTELSGTVSERSSTAVTSPKLLVTLEISTACMRGLPAILYGAMTIRRAAPEDHDAIWRILEPVIRAMQFNFVVSTNERAVRLWQSFGFEIVGRLPEAFEHPSLGWVDALVMFHRDLPSLGTAR